MIKNSLYLGTASISPNAPIVAGQMGTWVITYTVGKYGFDDAGTIRIAWRTVTDWGIPQFDRPKEAGYSTVWTDGEAKLTPVFDTYERPYGNSILIRLADGFLREGDTVRITLGDTSQGGPGIRAQSFVESEHEIRVLVDCMGTKVLEEVPGRIRIPVKCGPIHKIEPVVRPTVETGKPFDILIRALDEYGNACTDYDGMVALSIPELDPNEYELPETIKFEATDRGSKRLHGVMVKKQGSFHVKATESRHGDEVLSNGALAQDKNDYTLYFGDMHAQTRLTLGVGSLDEYYSFARDIGGVDFTGWQGNDFEIDDDKWEHVRQKTKEYNDPGKFLVFLGYEWSGITPRGGDHNVFFLGDNDHFYPSSNALDRNHRTDVKYNAPTMAELYKIIDGRKDVLTIPHVGGRHGNPDFFNPDFTSVVEIHSHHGTFEWFAKEYMKRHCKVGFIATSDDHTGRPGLSYPLGGGGNNLVSFDVGSGYSGVYAKSLSKEDIWEAIHSRRTFASDSARIMLKVESDGHMMGEEFDSATPPALHITAVGNAPVDTIQLYNWDKLIYSRNMLKKEHNRVRISWSGVRARTRKKSSPWDGQVSITGGRILHAENYAFDRADQGIYESTDQCVYWKSSTSGDYDGVILDLDANSDAVLHFSALPTAFDIKVADISETPAVFHAATGEDLKVEVVLANEKLSDEREYLTASGIDTVITAPEMNDGTNAYWVRILLDNGHMAWSSPLFVNRK